MSEDVVISAVPERGDAEGEGRGGAEREQGGHQEVRYYQLRDTLLPLLGVSFRPPQGRRVVTTNLDGVLSVMEEDVRNSNFCNIFNTMTYIASSYYHRGQGCESQVKIFFCKSWET